MNPNPLFDRNWFDIVKFNAREMSPGRIGVHVWKAGYNCQLLTVLEDQLRDASFPVWEHIRAIAYKRWDAGDPVNEEACPVCGSLVRLCRRSWRGREFCANCGEHWNRKPGSYLFQDGENG